METVLRPPHSLHIPRAGRKHRHGTMCQEVSSLDIEERSPSRISLLGNPTCLPRPGNGRAIWGWAAKPRGRKWKGGKGSKRTSLECVSGNSYGKPQLASVFSLAAGTRDLGSWNADGDWPGLKGGAPHLDDSGTMLSLPTQSVHRCSRSKSGQTRARRAGSSGVMCRSRVEPPEIVPYPRPSTDPSGIHPGILASSSYYTGYYGVLSHDATQQCLTIVQYNYNLSTQAPGRCNYFRATE
ncbi:hypothetical protein VTN77DRAFT_6757 [Rasamsonia byssochlamydoides]|uniref:uncharacterized protein n=1 Tax=Rasamsonia byssochlamydoides TaxID=89139 RepID=UPI003743E490